MCRFLVRYGLFVILLGRKRYSTLRTLEHYCYSLLSSSLLIVLQSPFLEVNVRLKLIVIFITWVILFRGIVFERGSRWGWFPFDIISIPMAIFIRVKVAYRSRDFWSRWKCNYEFFNKFTVRGNLCFNFLLVSPSQPNLFLYFKDGFRMEYYSIFKDYKVHVCINYRSSNSTRKIKLKIVSRLKFSKIKKKFEKFVCPIDPFLPTHLPPKARSQFGQISNLTQNL